MSAGQVDFAHHAPADEVLRIGLFHHAHKFVAGRSRKAVISALQFEIGIADSAKFEADQRKSGRPLRSGLFPDFHFAAIEINREHSES